MKGRRANPIARNKDTSVQTLGAFWGLTARNMRVFLKDKIHAALSFLTVGILFCLYVLFLRKLSIDSLTAMLTGQGAHFSGKEIDAFSDLWFLGGLIAVSCITIPLGFLGIYVSDREKGVLFDLSIAPLLKGQLAGAYFAGSVILTYGFCAVVFILANAIFAFLGYATLSAASYAAVLGILFLCTLASTAGVFALVLLIKSMGAYAAFSAITGIVSGFLMGAYMPMSVFPSFVRTFSATSPFYGGVCLLRGLITERAAEPILDALSGAGTQFCRDYGLNYWAFGIDFSKAGVAAYLAGTAVLFLGVCILCFPRRNRN